MVPLLIELTQYYRVRWVLPIPEDRHCRPPGNRYFSDVNRFKSTPVKTCAYGNSSEALATDADIIRRSLDGTLFPGISSDVGVHGGFGDEQEKSIKPLRK